MADTSKEFSEGPGRTIYKRRDSEIEVFLMTFADCVKKSHFYFKHAKLPADETMDIWTEEAGKFPSEFYDWAFMSLKAREKKLPDNFPQAVLELWQEWMRRNPEKIERREFRCKQKECADGLLFVIKDGVSFVFRCAECDSRADFVKFPKSSFHALSLNGYRSNNVEAVMERRVECDPGQWRKEFTAR